MGLAEPHRLRVRGEGNPDPKLNPELALTLALTLVLTLTEDQGVVDVKESAVL